jgi:superfamily I DNA/RNA helicase
MVEDAAAENIRKFDNTLGIDWNPPADAVELQQWFKEKAANLMVSAIDALGDAAKFDAIIVDEAQDFTSAWWFPVELMLRDSNESRWYVLHDPEQARVYGRGDSLPNIAFGVELNTNCRNTRKIAGYCGKVIDRESKTRDGAPEGELPVVGAVSAQTNVRRQHAVEVVSKWMASGLSPDRIAILSPWNEQNPRSVLNGLNTVAGIPVRFGEQGVEHWIDGKALFGCTIKSFKGLEADCIIICDVPECPSPGFNNADMYVAASRAKVRLCFIAESEVAAQQIRKWINKSNQ